MGKNFKGTLERGRRGAEQDGMRGMVQGLQDGFRGIPEPEVPRMAGDITAPSGGREYRSVGDFRGFK
jgi:hypothetical protein